ncbi:hypothetical protein WN943_000051 [Citrus x changshan-huyou]
MKDLEKRARRCYSEPVSLSSDQFAIMMLLDACFIVEVFCYTAQNEWNDPSFWIICIPGKLGRDLLLADNQLPFFVLQKFYDMTKTPEEDFHELISKFFSYVFQQALPRGEPNGDEEINHLVGFVHKSLWVPRPKTEQAENGEVIRIRCATLRPRYRRCASSNRFLWSVHTRGRQNRVRINPIGFRVDWVGAKLIRIQPEF